MKGTERLLLDEMFTPTLADRLRVEGFDVVAVAGHATLAAASDEEVMRWAATQGGRLVTENVRISNHWPSSRANVANPSRPYFHQQSSVPAERPQPGSAARRATWLA